MNVRELRKILRDLPADMPVLATTEDGFKLVPACPMVETVCEQEREYKWPSKHETLPPVKALIF